MTPSDITVPIRALYYNTRTAMLFRCRLAELHLRSVFLPEMRTIYVCNPKVAGSSIIQTLLALDKSVPNGVRNDHNAPSSRRKISSLREPRAFWECVSAPDAFRFAFVRNPYTRILSCYRDKIASGREPRFRSYLGIGSGESVSFAHFLQRVRSQPVHKMNRHWRPQSALIPEGMNLSFLGRFERLDRDLKIVADRLGAPARSIQKMTPHKTNTGNEIDLSRCEAALVEEIYRADFERFGYETSAG